jgi:hypothetical protein
MNYELIPILPDKEESFIISWIPAFAGMTILSHADRGEKTL